MGINSYLIAQHEGKVVGRLNFFHLGMGQKEEEFTQSGSNEGSDHPTTSYLQLLEWIQSISPEGVTWDIFDEYSMDGICPEGVKEIGLEAVVRAKAIELCYTSQTLMDMSDRIMHAISRDLDGNIVREGPRIFPPSFPRIEFEGNAMSIVQEPPPRQREEFVVLNWKKKHNRSVYAVPLPEAQSYMHQILTMGPLQAKSQRQRDQFGRDHLATTLADEIPQCIVVSLDTEWEVRKDTSFEGLTQETTLVRRHRPPEEWTMFHPDVYSQKHISDWISDSAFLCGKASNYVFTIRPRDATELSRTPKKRKSREGARVVVKRSKK